MAHWKFPDLLGFSALIHFIKQTKQASDANASDVSGLQEDVQGLASQTAETFEQVDAALTAMDSGKQDKAAAIPVTIPVSGWQSDSGAYPYCCDIAAEGVTENDLAAVYIAPESMDAAAACGLCPSCETLAGVIRIRAKAVPDAALAAEYHVEKGLV